MSRSIPPYPEGKQLLAGKTVVVTAAAGTGIGFWAARRAAEEGARVLISDLHERRLRESAERLEALTGRKTPAVLCLAFPEVCPPRAPSRISIATRQKPA